MWESPMDNEISEILVQRDENPSVTMCVCQDPPIAWVVWPVRDGFNIVTGLSQLVGDE